MTNRVLTGVLLILTAAVAGAADTVASPDGRVVAEVWVEAGVPKYAVRADGRPALDGATLGLVREDADLSRNLTLSKASGVSEVNDAYDLPGSKRLHNAYKADRRAFTLTNADGQAMDVVFQVSDDGVAFRYELPTPPDGRTLKVTKETTRFRLPDGAGVGQEFISMGQADADRHATYATMRPFTRNVFDPMDFTPWRWPG